MKFCTDGMSFTQVAVLREALERFEMFARQNAVHGTIGYTPDWSREWTMRADTAKQMYEGIEV